MPPSTPADLVSGLTQSQELDKSSQRNFGLSISCVAAALVLAYGNYSADWGMPEAVIYAFLVAALLFFVGYMLLHYKALQMREVLQTAVLAKVANIPIGDAPKMIGAIDQATSLALLLTDPNDPKMAAAIEKASSG